MNRVTPLKQHQELIIALFESRPFNCAADAVQCIEDVTGKRYSYSYIRHFFKLHGIQRQKSLALAKKGAKKFSDTCFFQQKQSIIDIQVSLLVPDIFESIEHFILNPQQKLQPFEHLLEILVACQFQPRLNLSLTYKTLLKKIQLELTPVVFPLIYKILKSALIYSWLIECNPQLENYSNEEQQQWIEQNPDITSGFISCAHECANHFCPLVVRRLITFHSLTAFDAVKP